MQIRLRTTFPISTVTLDLEKEEIHESSLAGMWRKPPACEPLPERLLSAVWLAVFAAALRAQAPSALLDPTEVNSLCLRSTQLMEAGGVAIPDLSRAAAPVIENVKQACTQLRLRPNSGQPTYALMMNVRAYLALADTVPKPYPFPEAARQQFAEVREESTRLDSHFRALLDSKDAQLTAPDRDNLARYADANRKLGAPQAGKPRVVFLGDSITELWRLNEYFPDRDFVNRGISGQICVADVGAHEEPT